MVGGFWVSHRRPIIGVAVCLGVVLLAARDNFDAMVRVRDAMTTTFDASPSFLNEPPDQLRATGFLTDDKAGISQLNSMFAAVFGRSEIDRIVALSSDRERARAIATLISTPVAGDRLDGCGSINDLQGKAVAIRHGYGCCSDFSKVFLAASEVIGLNVRETSNTVHTVDEFFDLKANKWVMIDPMLELMATDDSGADLSLWEVRQHHLSGQTVRYVYFGWHAIRGGGDPRFDTGYRNADARITLTMGTNVLYNDTMYKRLSPLPKSIRLAILHLMGVRPGYRMYLDEMSRPVALQMRCIWGAVWAALAGAAFVFLQLMTGLARRSRRTTGQPEPELSVHAPPSSSGL